MELDGDSAEIKAPRFALFDTNEDKHQEIIEFEQGKLSLFSSSTIQNEELRAFYRLLETNVHLIS